ncbi:Hsp20/alpha crystallin family protein [Halomarina litorea]|uniref:Hsp20/alpha crystallin family protein n=1 Tax=Halomarina litorea TaxID=2961595 RepID=UPI0020C3B941|nr:Hsp20 family protein [Halomarina sp. BCD28]
MFKELGERVESAVLDGIGKTSSRVQEKKPLHADLLESEDHYLVVFDAPGATSEDVEVRFDANTVKVRIDRFRDFYEDFDMRVPGRGLSLHGSVELPEEAVVDARGADATLTKTGTLRVRIPKVEDDEGPVTVDTREEGETTGETGLDETDIPTSDTGERSESVDVAHDAGEDDTDDIDDDTDDADRYD